MLGSYTIGEVVLDAYFQDHERHGCRDIYPDSQIQIEEAVHVKQKHQRREDAHRHLKRLS